MKKSTIWLVRNPASGSNDEDAITALKAAFEEIGQPVAHTVCFPDEQAPDARALAEAGVDVLAVFGGDGTTHSVVSGAYGWDGAVLVLPGGTMNILAKRLHGDVPPARIIARLGEREPSRVRPKVLRTRHGDGFSGMLAGPGAVWNDVREAMREVDVVGMVTAAKEAIARSADGPRVTVRLPRGADIDGARADGYAAITVTPDDSGLEANGYYAESLGDYAGQGLALLGRDFRNGPHDELGRHPQIVLASLSGEPMELLIDGEPFDGAVEEAIDLVSCEVDLLATRDPEQDTA